MRFGLAMAIISTGAIPADARFTLGSEQLGHVNQSAVSDVEHLLGYLLFR